MPIEFRCTQCNKLLRTGDDTAGKRAQCPQCGGIVEVPAQQPFQPPQAGAAYGTQNPYQSPGQAGVDARGSSQLPPITPTRLDFGEVFDKTWLIFKDQWGPVLLITLIVFVIQIILSGMGTFGAEIVAAATRSIGAVILFHIVFQLVAGVVSTFLGIGQILFLLKIARGQPADISDLFAGGPWFLPAFVGGILLGLIVLGGTLLCIVPGVILALMFSQIYFFIIDRNTAVLDSFSLSKDITEGNKLTLFAIGIVAFLIFLAAVIPCGLGLIVAVPYFALMYPVMYLMMTGQPTVLDRGWTQPPTY